MKAALATNTTMDTGMDTMDPSAVSHRTHWFTVVECVERNVTDEIRGKLAAVSQRLECDTILCGIQKFCQAHGTLEGNRTDVFTHEENIQLRNAFIGCKPQPVATTGDAAQQASEAAAEA
ncbi:hypothetical protein MTO96_016546 [Rhipicephalus appendiculatus]